MAKGVACGETSSPAALDAVPYWAWVGETCSPAALDAIPYWHYIEGHGWAKPVRPQPLTSYLIGTMVKGVALDTVPYWHYGEGCGWAKPVRPQPFTPYLFGTVAKGVGVAKPLRLQPLTPYLIGTLAKGLACGEKGPISPFWSGYPHGRRQLLSNGKLCHVERRGSLNSSWNVKAIVLIRKIF
uniref:Uncharacterized protein n=1 Tax=Oryza barthii TaxID=65489 RepID=A0A0D3FKB2_9ORYZ